VTGAIDRPGDEDRFAFTAKKGDKFLFEIQSAALGFPVDPRLRIEDARGKELAKSDDSGGPDPKLEWSASESGTFVAVVDNVLHRGDEGHWYRLHARRALPELKLTVPETAFSMAPGRTNEIKVAVKRLYDFRALATLSVQGLPDGVTAAPVDLPEKSGDAVLRLVTSTNVAPFSGVIRIVAREAGSSVEHRVLADLTSSTVNNGVPGGFTTLAIESTDQFWFTVLPKK